MRTIYISKPNYVREFVSELLTFPSFISESKIMSENGESRKRKTLGADDVEVGAEIPGGSHVERVNIGLEEELPQTGDKFELDKMLLQDASTDS